MAKTDAQIGANLQRFRGEMTQTELARLMNTYGHRWSQPTVVAVEKGERPLRFSEAIDLASILGIDRVDHLGSDERGGQLVASWGRLFKDHDALIDASRTFDSARLQFAAAAVAAVDLESSVIESGLYIARRSPEEAIRLAREDGLISDPADLPALVARLEGPGRAEGIE